MFTALMSLSLVGVVAATGVYFSKTMDGLLSGRDGDTPRN